MNLLHTEIQTELRDLVTVPNLYMVTQPLHVVRASGTIIKAEVSLGYDVSHGRAAEVLRGAAAKCGLKDGFVQVLELGDFSVTYRVAGLLQDVKNLISARSSLRAAMLDALHAADIEIVSPTFMNTRAVKEGRLFIPEPSKKGAKPAQTQAENVAFDLAEEAASMEKIRMAIEQADAELKALGSEEGEGVEDRKSALETKKAQLAEQYRAAEEQRKARELAEQDIG
jgi:small-conductance mechanosensitive channel